MSRHYLKLLFFTLLLHEYNGPIRRIIMGTKVLEEYDWLFDFESVVIVISNLFIFSLFAFSTFFILNQLFSKSSRLKVILGVVLGIFAVIGLRYFLQEMLILWVLGFDNYVIENALFYLQDNTYYAILYSGIGAIYFFYQYAIEQENNKNKLEIKNKESQLTFLKAQVNPHFLFNSLNNIYSLVNKNSEHALPAIEKLSGLLRYSLYEQQKKVSLQKELSLMYDYIGLEEFRVDGDIDIEVDIESSAKIDTMKIAPYLLLPFVENAFKHGDLKNSDQPITIRLYTSNEYLHFEVKNAKKQKMVDQQGGIGLTNIQRRLQLIYQDNQDLRIENTSHFFFTHLKIKLSEC